jgi:photosystem II stability/assembly factor-like uncharacterized protein
MKKLLALSLIIVLTGTISLYSQNWLKDYNQDNEFSFKKLEHKFNEYWQGKTPYKGSGFKQYKRMEWLVKPRFWKTDGIPNLAEVYKDYLNYSRDKKNIDKMLDYPEWHSLGPVDKPIPQNTYLKAGTGRISCIGIDPDNSNIIYAGSATGGIWKTTDKGSTWVDLPLSSIMSIGISDIVVAKSNNNIIYAGTGDADAAGFLGANFSFSIGVLKSTDAGGTWVPTNLAFQVSEKALINKILVDPQNADIVYAATNKGIFRTTDGGDNWNRVNTNYCRDMKFQPNNAGIIYCVMRKSHSEFSIEKYNISTSSFLELLRETGVGRIVLATNEKKPTTMYALMATSYPYYAFHSIWRTTDGTHWVKRADKSNSPNYLAFLANGLGVEGQGLYDLALAINPDNENEVFLGGVNIYKSTDGGAKFSPIAEWTGQFSLPWVHADIHMLKFDDENNLYACTDGGLNRSSNFGTSWTDLSDGLKITQFYSISSARQENYLISGGSQDNGSHLYKGTSWVNVYGGDGMNTIIDYTNSQIMYVSLYYGRIMKSTNGGQTFKQIISSDNTHEQGAWVTPYLLHPTNHNTIYVGLENVWKSIDGGIHWTKISNFQNTNPPTKIQSMAISDRNPNTMYITFANKIYKTTMGGSSWNLVGSMTEYITSIVVDPKSANRYWVTLSGYTAGSKVMYYNGQKYENISSGLPNMPVNCLVYQKNTQNRLYCGTDAGVFTRDDANKEWELFNNGLPNVIVNALEIHAGTGKLRAGTYGRGLWEVSVVNCNLAPPEIEIEGSTELCDGDSVKLECKGVYSTYEWSTGSTSRAIWVKSRGSYSVRVTDADGCSATSDVINVSVTKTPEFDIKVVGGDAICEGDTTILIASTFYYKYYHWSNGDSTKRINVTKPGTYSVVCETKEGCKKKSENEITITTLPPAEKPVITEVGNKLVSSEAKTYQWFFNGDELEGETGRELLPHAPGTYQVKITNDDNCSAMSEPYELTTDVEYNVDEAVKIIPNPTNGEFRILFRENNNTVNDVRIIISDLTGQIIIEKNIKLADTKEIRFDLSGQSNGIYFININSGFNSSIYKIVKNTK